MKKFILFLALVLLCSCSLAQERLIPCAYAELSKTKAQELALQYCEDELGYPKDTITIKQYANDNDGWAFSFMVVEPDPTTNGLIILHMDGKGNLTDITGPQPISLYQQFENAWMDAIFSYQAVYQTQQEWRPRLAHLSPEEQEDFDRNSRTRPVLAFMEHDVSLPTEQDISYEEAVQKSREAILALPGWTEEMLELIRIKGEVYHIPPNHDRPVYQFVYGLQSSVGQSIYVRSNHAKPFDYKYWAKREDAMFGEALPSNINVRIDAQTGALVGEVYVQTPFQDFITDPMICFLWEVESREPVAEE